MKNTTMNFGDVIDGKRFYTMRKSKAVFLTEKGFQQEIERRKLKNGTTRSIKNLASKMISHARIRARNKNGKCDIDIARVENEIMKGSHYGILYTIGATGKSASPYVPSLDRIDSSNPDYIFNSDPDQDTCQVVPYGINCLRNNFQDSDAIICAAAYVRFHSRKLGLVKDASCQTD